MNTTLPMEVVKFHISNLIDEYQRDPKPNIQCLKDKIHMVVAKVFCKFHGKIALKTIIQSVKDSIPTFHKINTEKGWIKEKAFQVIKETKVETPSSAKEWVQILTEINDLLEKNNYIPSKNCGVRSTIISFIQNSTSEEKRELHYPSEKENIKKLDKLALKTSKLLDINEIKPIVEMINENDTLISFLHQKLLSIYSKEPPSLFDEINKWVYINFDKDLKQFCEWIRHDPITSSIQAYNIIQSTIDRIYDLFIETRIK